MAWIRLCRRCSYRLWQILAILLILLALGVSSLRLLAPYADYVKAPVQNWFAQNYRLKLDYEALQIEWQHFGLYLTLKQVDIDPLEGDDQVKSLDSLSVRFEPWGSLLSQRVRFGDIQLQGLQLEISTSSRESEKSSSHMTWQQVLRELTSNRFEEFELTDARLTLVDSELHKQALIIPSLVWRNEPFSHKGEGLAHMEGYPEQLVNFIVDIRGRKEAPEEITGRLYLNVEHLSPHPFIQSWKHDAVEILHSEVNFQAWLRFDWERLQQAWLALGDNNIRWRHQGLAQERRFQLQDGNFVFRGHGAGWQMISHNVKAQTNGYHWPEIALTVAKNGVETRAEIDRLDLAGITPLLEFYPGLSERLAEVANQTSGALRELRWQHSEQDGWLLRGRVQDASWQQSASVPGIEELDGEFELSSGNLLLQLEAGNQTLQPGGQFAEAIPIEAFQAELSAQWQKGDWQLNISKLSLQTTHLSTELSAQMSPDAAGQPQLFLYGEIAVPDAVELWRYYPTQGMSANLNRYLTRAIKGGHSELTQLLWHGTLSEFPYAHGTGAFHIVAPVAETRMKFNPDWPALDADLLTLDFQNQDLYLTAQGAQLLDAQVEGLTAQIPGLRKDSILTIEGQILAQAEQVRAVIDQSMLAPSLGETLQVLDLKGPVSGPLRLDIPLSGKQVKVQGYADLAEAQLNIPGSSQHKLEQVTGRVYYQQEAIQIENMIGQYHQLPVQLSLTGDQQGDHYGVHAWAEGVWPVEVLKQHPQLSLPPGQGEFVWQGDVQVQVNQQGTQAEIKLTSDLNALAIELPAPMQKSAGQSWPTRVDISIANSQLNGRAVVGEQLFAMWQQQLSETPSDDDFVWLGVGTQQPLKGTPGGVTLDLELPALDFTPWLGLSGQSKGSDSATLPFEQGTWRIGEAKIFDYQLPQLEIALRQQPMGWQAELTGSQVLADLSYQANPEPRLQLKARQLILTKAEGASPAPTSGGQPLSYEDQLSLLSSIPALEIECRQCQWEEYFFDELHLSSETQADLGQWRANEAWFKVGSGEVALEQFVWQITDSVSQTQLKGRIKAQDFDEMTRGLMPSSELPIKDSELEGEFQFVWPNAPFDFEIAALEGRFNWLLGPGHIAELSDKGARVFTLLSMDSLIRKIRLDFSDVFDKGLFYNAMEGSFEFHQGEVISDPIEMDGVAGDMTIKGKTNLLTQALDYEVVFNPDLTGSLPLLAGLTINPVTGIYVLALHTVMKPVVEVVTQIRFQITGTTDEPVVTEVGRSKKEIKVEQAAPEATPLPEGSSQQEDSATKNEPVADQVIELPLPSSQTQTAVETQQTDSASLPESTQQTESAAASEPLAPTQQTGTQESSTAAEPEEPAELLPELPVVAPITVGERKKE